MAFGVCTSLHSFLHRSLLDSMGSNSGGMAFSVVEIQYDYEFHSYDWLFKNFIFIFPTLKS